MSDPVELPPRPAPQRPFVDVARSWLAWFGLGRLLVTAGSVLVVLGGGYLLLRAPALPPEAELPVAAANPPSSTLPPPTTMPAVGADGPSDGPSVAGPGQGAHQTLAGTSPTPVVVHVAGAVVGPGVYRLAGDARVHTAIEAAGGVAPDADLDGLNLAAAVVDGERVYVPVVGEVDPASVPSRPPQVGDAGGPPRPAGPLDLNAATAAEFDALPGVGPATATAIVDDRDRNGPFATVDDLDRVPGIGPAKLAALRDLVTV